MMKGLSSCVKAIGCAEDLSLETLHHQTGFQMVGKQYEQTQILLSYSEEVQIVLLQHSRVVVVRHDIDMPVYLYESVVYLKSAKLLSFLLHVRSSNAEISHLICIGLIILSLEKR